MFVKEQAKVLTKRIPLVGILHYASDWILLADLIVIIVSQSILHSLN